MVWDGVVERQGGRGALNEVERAGCMASTCTKALLRLQGGRDSALPPCLWAANAFVMENWSASMPGYVVWFLHWMGRVQLGCFPHSKVKLRNLPVPSLWVSCGGKHWLACGSTVFLLKPFKPVWTMETTWPELPQYFFFINTEKIFQLCVDFKAKKPYLMIGQQYSKPKKCTQWSFWYWGI